MNLVDRSGAKKHYTPRIDHDLDHIECIDHTGRIDHIDYTDHIDHLYHIDHIDRIDHIDHTDHVYDTLSCYYVVQDMCGTDSTHVKHVLENADHPQHNL